jgi:hypothetical protein
MATATPPSKLKLPPRPTPADLLGSSALNTDSPSNSPTSLFGSVPHPKPRRTARPSFSTAGQRRESVIAHEDEVPKLPTLVPGIRPAYSTPLPTLPMVVLCIVSLPKIVLKKGNAVRAALGESVYPFLAKDGRRLAFTGPELTLGFFIASGRDKNSETEAAVGLWTGKSAHDPAHDRKPCIRLLHHPVLHIPLVVFNCRPSRSTSCHCG